MTKALSKAAKRRAGQASAEARRKAKQDHQQWDHGAMGEANRIGLVVEERGEVDPKTGKRQNPNGVTGVRRVDLLEYWLKRGSISQEGYSAASMLKAAFDATMKGKPALPDNDRVQSSPKPDHAIDIQIDRLSRFHAVMRFVAPKDRQIVSACVLHGQHPARVYGALRMEQGFAHLREALDRLADSIAARKIA